ncbi:hypothetical protein [uncultured Sanguibacteroides sp.]|uniref:golvesin C-terminal-like domain-containing protein n=1 Tax=uncultured Sanguibacteroides sp. TaxID=1635151 RepID=UPI0025D472C2|nr:hypothetical protein [uncultured Sanguibacteroides sp.]
MNFRNVGLLACYEIKTISREWSFRMVTVLSVLIVTSLHVITQSNLVEPEWIAISLPSAIPYSNACLVISLQMIIIIFFAGNFLRGNRPEGSNSALSARPYSNLELLWGKTTGFLILMFGVALLQGTIAIFIHLFGSDSPFVLYPYVFYFFTLTCPILFFFTGLTMYVKGITRTPALAIVLLIGSLYFFLSFGSELFYGAFDVSAISLPNTFSDLTGFTGLGGYLLQRSSFLAWGCGLILLSISFVNRLPSGTKSNFSIGRQGVWFVVLGLIFSGFYTESFIRRDHERKTIRETLAKYQPTPKVSITDHNIEFKQEGYTYSASSRLNLLNTNNQKIDSVILYLNSGLKVLKLTYRGKAIPFRREHQVLTLPLSMKPGETKQIEIEYGGSISSVVCYPEIVDIDSLAKNRLYYQYNMGQNYYYLQPDYTLLTPECLWYPTSKPNVNVNLPLSTDQDYTRFTLLVKGEPSRTAISQGEETREGENTRFMNKIALPGLTLCMGDYTRKSLQKNGILYEIFLFRDHEYLIPEEITPEEAIKSWKRMFGYNDKAYVFTKLNLVETPIHFCAYSRNWKNNSEQVQPEIILRPEREALLPWTFSIKSNQENQFLDWYMNYLASGTRDFPMGNMFFNRLTGNYNTKKIKNESDIYFLQQKDHYNVYSSSPEFTGINRLFHYMQQGFYTNFNDGVNVYYIGKNLRDRNLAEVLGEPNDEKEVDKAIYARGYYFLKYILYRPVSPEEFERFNSNFIQSHAFQSFSYEKYCEEFENQFGIPLLELTRNLYNENGFPAFHFKDAQVDDVETVDGKLGYVFSIKVWNKGKRNGILSFKHVDDIEKREYFIPKGSCKEIKIYFEGDRDSYTIILYTNDSQNLPSYYTFNEFPEKGIIEKPVDGIFETDTLAFAPEPNVYIVDNEDPGCRIVEHRRSIEKLRKSHKTRWYWLDNENAYGEVSKTFFRKAAKGNSEIEWEVNLPESGKYELFIYNPLEKSKNYLRKRKERETWIQKYRFVHDKGKEEVEVALLEAEHGWVSLGTYQFHAGKTKITLSGQGANRYQYMYADAVKWVKIK